MLSGTIFEVALSLVLVYALLSILVSIINEIVSAYAQQRANTLRESLLRLLNDEQNLRYGELLYSHAHLQDITFEKARRWFSFLRTAQGRPPRKVLPSYISSSTFAEALIEIIAAQATHLTRIETMRDASGGILTDASGRKQFTKASPVPEGDTAARFHAALGLMNPSPFRDQLTLFYDLAGGDIGKLKSTIEDWFNSYQDRVSGWYQARQQRKLRVIGLLAAVLLNADTFHMLKVIGSDSRLRARLVTEAEHVAGNYAALNDSLRNDVTSLLGAFSQSDPEIARATDSLRRIHGDSLSERPRLLTDVLLRKHSARYDSLSSILLRNDSIRERLQRNTGELLSIAGALQLPIGYDERTAPLSWFNKKAASTPRSADTDYYIRRNNGGFWVVCRYLAGILLTGFALSVGAPFWFTLLLRFVNVRRTGAKPKSTSS